MGLDQSSLLLAALTGHQNCRVCARCPARKHVLLAIAARKIPAWLITSGSQVSQPNRVGLNNRIFTRCTSLTFASRCLSLSTNALFAEVS
jgi:hypothetical protein